MIKNATVLVGGVCNGQPFQDERWDFEMTKPDPEDYGNGRYIVVNHNGDFHCVIDIRYGKAELLPHVEAFLERFYGNNMRSAQYSFVYEEEE